MSLNLFPLPIDTPISDDSKWPGLKLGNVWNRFFKAISDDLLSANIANDLPATSVSAAGLTDPQLAAAARAFKYILNANLCFVTYSVDAALSVPAVFRLPFSALLPFDFGGDAQPAGAKSITIPAGTAYLRFWYVVNPQKQGAI